MIWSNWAGNVRAQPRCLHLPDSEDALSRVIGAASAVGRRVKVVGAGHSCSTVASSDRVDALRLDKMAQLLAVDRAARTVTVQAGMTLAALNDALAEHGLALPNLGAIAEQTVAGAFATGTHGTGMAFSGLSEFLVGARLVSASGEVIEIRDGEMLDGVRTHVGALGVLASVTLRCDEAFDLRCRDEPATLDDAVRELDRLNAAGTFGMWWFPHVDRVLLRTLTKVPPEGRAPAGRLASWWRQAIVGNRLHELLLTGAARGLLSGERANGLWFSAAFARARSESGRSDRMLAGPPGVRQRVLEYALPYERAGEALLALRALIKDSGEHAQAPIDVRFGRAESAWLGLAHGRATCFIGVIGYRPFGLETAWEPLFRRVDGLLRGLDGRPHWGKVHWQDARSLRPLYPRFDDFLALRRRFDPTGMFLNDYLCQVLGVGS